MSVPCWIVDDEAPGKYGWPERKAVFIGSHAGAIASFLERDAKHPGRPKLLDPRGDDRSEMARRELAERKAASP